MNNNQQSAIDNHQSLRDALYGLYLLADQHRGEPRFIEWDAGLVVGLVVSPAPGVCDPAVHRLQLSRREKSPTTADWRALQDALPYHLRIEPRAYSHNHLHVLEATYTVTLCVCGGLRVLSEGVWQSCARCQAQAIVWSLPALAVLQ